MQSVTLVVTMDVTKLLPRGFSAFGAAGYYVRDYDEILPVPGVSNHEEGGRILALSQLRVPPLLFSITALRTPLTLTRRTMALSLFRRGSITSLPHGLRLCRCSWWPWPVCQTCVQRVRLIRAKRSTSIRKIGALIFIARPGWRALFDRRKQSHSTRCR